MGPETVPPVRCCWCAPTAIVVVAVSPATPSGGAAFAALPWQLLHASEPTSTAPFTCAARLTLVSV